MVKRMILMLVIVGAFFAGVFSYRAFTSKMMNKMMAASYGAPEVVSAITIKRSSWQSRIKAIATVRAFKGVDITTEAPGVIKETLFKSGDTVKAGQVLVRLNTETEAAQLKALEVEARLAVTIYERDRKQYAVGAVSLAVLDADIAQLKAKRAVVERQKAIIAQKNICAPFDGRLGINNVNSGQYINPGEKIVTLQALDSVYVDFSLPQQELSRLVLGQIVEVGVDSYPSEVFTGKIMAIDPQVEATTRSVRVEALMDNLQHKLLAGMYATIQVLAGEAREYLTIPQSAVTFNPYGETVFLVNDDNKVKQKFIKTGETRGDQIAVLEGLKDGDTVVTSGQIKLKNGSLIKVDNSSEPYNDAKPQVEEE
jgi:membrane fusion protein (multidrug efflux system)